MKSILIVLLLATPIVAGAEIYKWTDAQGRVHFSDKPVTKNGKTEIVEVKDYKPGTDENVRQIYERNDRLRHATTEKTPKQQQAPALTAKKQQADCTAATARLAKISHRIEFHDEQGNLVPTTEKERARKEQELRLWISENCT